jgi:pimeloyl-ACP methyl ester carboxylesterase
VILVLALAGLAAAPPAGAAPVFEPCPRLGGECATVEVPLDRGDTVPGNVKLLVQRFKLGRRPARRAVIVLAGGPGQSAVGGLARHPGLSAAASPGRDVIVFDQRGTGRSGLLRCPSLERSNLLGAGDEAATCAATLGPARAFYTTRESVADIESIRRELGLERISLFGVSYGTHVALAYSRRYPERVESLVLDSPLEPEGLDPLWRRTAAATPRVLRELCGRRCRRFTDDPVADLRALVRRLDRAPLRGRLIDARGNARPASLDHGDLFLTFLTGDLDPDLREAFPGAVRSALQRDPTPLLRLERLAELDTEPAPPQELSLALFAATACEEMALPWSRGAPPDPSVRRALARAAVLGLPEALLGPFGRRTALDSDLLRLCERWPAQPVDPIAAQGPFPDVPMLALVGRDDVRTPMEGVRRVVSLFPRGLLLTVGGVGHSVIGTDETFCAPRAVAAFYEGRAVPRRCPGPRRGPLLGPPPRSLGAVQPAPGLAGRLGRTIAALALTLRDVRDDPVAAFLPLGSRVWARGGGLRGGRYRIGERDTLAMHRVEYIPGVRVSGRLHRFGLGRQRGRLRLGGPAAPRGRLSLRRGVLRGTLADQRVHVRMPRVRGGRIVG